MTAYYPSQAGYATTQPVMYGPSQGYAQPYGMSAGYAPSGGVMYVPTYGSGRHHRHHHNDYMYRVPQVAAMNGAPVVMQQGYNGHHHNHYYSWGARFRRFFGLAPSQGVRYKSDRGTWGFMGYSRRQRYVDPRTGGEVDRQGRPVYRV
ncbi:hypothetical protein BDZ97DRAFT_1899980 [Flammula alnicola]|nr:hypothetical protein BDZ97DRAFT_1899980 [Flammula alnicola]